MTKTKYKCTGPVFPPGSSHCDKDKIQIYKRTILVRIIFLPAPGVYEEEMRKRTLPSQPGIDEEICNHVPLLRVIHVVSAILPQPGYTPNRRAPGITNWGRVREAATVVTRSAEDTDTSTPASSGSVSDGTSMLTKPTPSEPSQSTASVPTTASHASESNP